MPNANDAHNKMLQNAAANNEAAKPIIAKVSVLPKGTCVCTIDDNPARRGDQKKLENGAQ